MILLTKQHLIDGICDRWLSQYYYLGAWKYGKDKEQIYHNLAKLGDKKTEESIAKVIGNGSWTHLTCDECAAEVDSVLIFLEDWDSPVQICKSCIDKASMILSEQENVE